jgi:hypothetical protein
MRRQLLITAAIVCLAFTIVARTTGNPYPIAPPGSHVDLSLHDFLMEVVDHHPWMSMGQVTGDHIGGHPGGFGIGNPPEDWYFVGLFSAPLDTGLPGASVYLWETSSGPNTVPFEGPEVQLGHWNGSWFVPLGVPRTAYYLGTGAPADDGFREITSSILSMQELGIQPQWPLTVNAVRVRATVTGHNQVTAIAARVVPEPSGLAVFGLGIVSVGLWLKRRQR